MFWDGKPPYSFRGLAALHEGEVVAIGGVYFAGDRFWAFSGLKTERMSRRMRVLGIRAMVGYMDAQRVPLYAAPDPDHPTAFGLLLHLGFTPTGDMMDGLEILVRRPKWRS